MVAPFEVGLIAIGGQHLGGGHGGVVGDERETAIGRGVVGDLLGPAGGADGEDGLLTAPVAGLVARAARRSWRNITSLPSLMVKPTQRRAPAAVRAVMAASSAATLVFRRVLGPARRIPSASIAASPASMRAARAAASRAALLLACTQITR